MPSPNAPPTSRYALSLWFLGIAALGLVQFFGKAHREAGPTAIAWIWLAGSLLLLALAILLAWRERVRDKRSDPDA